MVSETYKNSQDQALEERLSNMHEQMAGVTSRLDQTERALDLERATREDIIKAEMERRIREAEQRIRKEIESEYADERAVIAELVRMIFTQKRERLLVSEEDRTGVHNHLLASLKFNEEEANYKKAFETVKKYIIAYRNIDTGIPIFLTAVDKGNGRGKEVIQAQLANWSGLALMCDAYPGYDWIEKTERVLCRCSAHARREHERALKEAPKSAMPGMLLFQEIYGVEEIIRHENASGSRITELRNELARPLWETLHLWCMNEILNHDKHSQMYKALNYVIRHFEELTAYLDIPEMPLDNNETEREIRAMVMGKKAYLFCQTDEACERAAMMYSFFGAFKVKGKNPERWLAYVLDHIGSTKDEDLYKLLPEFWEDIN